MSSCVAELFCRSGNITPVDRAPQRKQEHLDTRSVWQVKDKCPLWVISGHGPPDIISYSFDMLLPIIRLRESHYQVDLKTWARYYFYFHKIMGYVLASFLIAG